MYNDAPALTGPRSVTGTDTPPPPIQISMQRLIVNIDDAEKALTRLMEKVKFVRADRPSPELCEASGANVGSSPIACQLNMASDRLRSLVTAANILAEEIEL